MKVLVVHDRQQVGEEISSIARTSSPDCEVTFVGDGAGARRALHNTYFDLLILDLTIPNVTDYGNVGFQVAEGLLEELFNSDGLMQPANILGITQDSTALDQIQNNIGPHLMAVISEDIDGLWRGHLLDRIKYVQHSSRCRANAALTKHDFDLLVVTALDKELTPIRELFELQPLAHLPGVSEFWFTDKLGVPRRGACSAIGRAGQASAASETQGLLCQLRPRLSAMIGFCGGVPGKAELGDVLIAEQSLDWDFGKWKRDADKSRLYSRPEPIPIRNSKAHRIARQLVEEGLTDQQSFEIGVAGRSDGHIKSPTLRLVPFASGSAVVGDANVLSEIKDLQENVGGVDMESYGFYYACKHPKAAPPEFICIKAVSDHCGPDKDDRLHKACSFASCYVLNEIITKHWDF